MSLLRLEDLTLKIDTTDNREYRTQLLVEYFTVVRTMIANGMFIEKGREPRANRAGVRDIELTNTYENKRCAYGSRCFNSTGRRIGVGETAIWLPEDSDPPSLLFHPACFLKWMDE